MPSKLNLTLASILFITCLVSLTIGPLDITLNQLFNSFFREVKTPYTIVIFELRLPRIFLGILVGASLGLSGAALQGLLRNPLADPGILGVSTTASLGAVIALYFGLGAIFILSVPIMAMLGALFATSILYYVASRDASVLTLILVGIAISSLAAALTALAMNLAPNPYSLREMIMWLMGSLNNRSWSDIYLAGPFIIIGWALILPTGRGLQALVLGEETAISLGIDLKKLRTRIVVGVALCVGAGVAISGAIGFIGLVVPHMIRPFVGQEPGRTLVPSAIGGALLLVLSDLFARLMPTASDIRLGVVTALLGAPLFLWLIIKTRGEMR